MVLPPIHYDITHCAECGDAAYLRCQGCSNLLDVWYCRKECQQSHWKQHKIECKSARLYDKIRSLQWPIDAQQVQDAEDEFNLKIDAITRQYLGHVPIEARPRAMDGDTFLKEEVLDAVKHLAETTTIRGHSDNIKARFEMLKESFKDKFDFEAPFSVRPVTENGDGDLGIQLFVQDYAMLSLKIFEERFAEGKKTTVNPWAGQANVSRRGEHKVLE